VIGTVRCHDYGRTFSGFGANERRAHRVQASTSRRVVEHSARRVEQVGFVASARNQGHRNAASDFEKQLRE
jgi:hypothetical protein